MLPRKNKKPLKNAFDRTINLILVFGALAEAINNIIKFIKSILGL